jgi:hypothetical protein
MRILVFGHANPSKWEGRIKATVRELSCCLSGMLQYG